MRITIRPLADPGRELDITRTLVSAIAAELWRLYGGNETLNWLEAERHLQRIIEGARDEARDAAVLSLATPPVGFNGNAIRTSPRRVVRRIRSERSGHRRTQMEERRAG